MSALTKRQRAFADAWNGTGTGIEAARSAGYSGAPSALAVQASKLIRHPGVRARIMERLGPNAFDGVSDDPGPQPPPIEPGSPLVKGRGRGTATERIEIAMSIARRKTSDDRDRLAALRLAAELEGELRPARAKAGPPAPIAAPIAPPPTGTRRGGLSLVLSDVDQGGSHG